MPKTKISLSIESTSQPKQYHSLKMGIIIHEVEIEYENDQDLNEKIMSIENKYQMVLNNAKNLALDNKLYVGTIENFYDNELNSEVLLKYGDQRQEENKEYVDTFEDEEDDESEDMEEVDPDIDDLDLNF